MSEVITKEAFPKGEHTITKTDDKGKPVKYVLLEDGRIAKIVKGKGKHVEQATLIAGGDQSKYFSALMAAVTTVDEKPVIMEDLSEFDMQDYMHIQLAFSEINF